MGTEDLPPDLLQGRVTINKATCFVNAKSIISQQCCLLALSRARYSLQTYFVRNSQQLKHLKKMFG